MMAVWLFANCCLLSRYHLIPAQAAPHPWREPVICAAWAGRGKECQELMIPIIRQKPLFIHHFGSCDPASLANTSRTVNTRQNFTRFYICADTEWWSDIQILFVTRCYGRVCQDCDHPLITGTSYVFIFIEESSRGVIMQTSGDHSRSSPSPQIFMNADTSTRLWCDEAVIIRKRNTATWSDIILSQFQLLRIHSSIFYFWLAGWLIQMLRKYLTGEVRTREGGEMRRGEGTTSERDAKPNDLEVRLVRT